VLRDASDTISSMRIAARRRDWDKLMRAAADLPELSQKLQMYEDLPA
jgi:hypothetical protein